MLNIDTKDINHPLFIVNIIFIDKAFELIGNINRHNCKYWSDENLNCKLYSILYNIFKIK